MAGYRILRDGPELVGKTTLLAMLPEQREFGIGRALQRLRVNLMRDAGAARVITNADRPETIAWDERHFGYRRVGEVEKLHEFGLPDVDRWTTLEAQLAEPSPDQASRDTARAMSQENVEVVRRWWGGFNDDGMPPLSLCDEQIEIRMPPDFPVRGLFQGHEGVRRWREQVFDVAENARVEPEEIVDVHGDGETVLMLLRATGTAGYSEIEIDIEWAAIWTIRDGKVLRAQGYLNRAEAIAAAGLSE